MFLKRIPGGLWLLLLRGKSGELRCTVHGSRSNNRTSALAKLTLGDVEVGEGRSVGRAVEALEFTIVDPVLNVDLGVDVTAIGWLISAKQV